MPSWCFADTMQVTVKFGAHHLVINEIASATLGKELKSLVRTRLGSCLPRNARFQIKSQENGRILRVLETLGEVSMLCFETKQRSYTITIVWFKKSFFHLCSGLLHFDPGYKISSAGRVSWELCSGNSHLYWRRRERWLPSEVCWSVCLSFSLSVKRSCIISFLRQSV